MYELEHDTGIAGFSPGTPEEAAYQRGRQDGIAFARKQLLVVAVLGKVLLVGAVFIAGKLAWS